MAKKKPVKQLTIDGITSKTADGFANFASRLGLQQQNSFSFGTYILNLVTRNRVKLESAYRGSWVVGQMVDSVADDMTRAGIDITTSEDETRIQEIKVAMSRLQIWQSLNKVIKWGRLYGGSIGVMDIEGQDNSTPLDPDTVGGGQFKGIVVYDRWQLNPDLTTVIDSGPEMGLPEYYYITTNNNINDPMDMDIDGGLKIHHSRCIRYIGIELPFFQAITEMMWGESILERVWDRLIAFDSTTMSIANLVERASNRTVKVDQLRDVIASGGKAMEGLLSQFDMMREFQTNEGLTLLDKEDEYQTDSYTFAGVDLVLLGFAQQLSGASQIPLVRLFSQTPTGMSATGESDIRMYYDSINAQQESKLRNPMEVLMSVLYKSEFDQPKPEDFQFSFTPLWQMSAMDKASIAKLNTETIIGAFAEGLTKRSTAMKELRAISDDTGIFSNITDEDIDELDNDLPPVPQEIIPSKENPTGEVPHTNPSGISVAAQKLPLPKLGTKSDDAKPSTFKKIKTWLKR